METLNNLPTGEELYALCAVDSNLYGRQWFPKACRQPTPDFHIEMDTILMIPDQRLVGFEVFRGGAKTTRLRLFASKRIAYAISRTVLFVGKSEGHAIKSVKWLKTNVMYNRKWADFYGLKMGQKRSDTEIEIINTVADVIITVIAIGITGSTRGINVDDYRPDLIVVDDPCDEENTATKENRQKIENLFFGALLKSLAAPGDMPNAKMVLAQTPLNNFDLISEAKTDPRFVTVSYSCFNADGTSRWEAMFPTKFLNQDKEAHIKKNQLSIWLREMECKVVNAENSAFLEHWLQYYDTLPDGGINYLTVDPTPPPKDSTVVVENQKLDDAVVMVVKFFDAKVYVCDYYACKSPDPGELINMIFMMAIRWRVFQIGVETVLFQRVLKWNLEQEMLKRRQFFTVIPVEDKRDKSIRIIQTISRYASVMRLYVSKQHTDLKQQFILYRPGVRSQKDDYLDALSIAIDMINPGLEGVTIEGEYTVIDEEDQELLTSGDWRGAP